MDLGLIMSVISCEKGLPFGILLLPDWFCIWTLRTCQFLWPNIVAAGKGPTASECHKVLSAEAVHNNRLCLLRLLREQSRHPQTQGIGSKIQPTSKAE